MVISRTHDISVTKPIGIQNKASIPIISCLLTRDDVRNTLIQESDWPRSKQTVRKEAERLLRRQLTYPKIRSFSERLSAFGGFATIASLIILSRRKPAYRCRAPSTPT